MSDATHDALRKLAIHPIEQVQFGDVLRRTEGWSCILCGKDWEKDQPEQHKSSCLAAPRAATADGWRDPNPWHPISNAIDLKHLGKLGEEVNELGAAISRCIIQGVDECEPVTKKPNKLWLQEEIADVLANIPLVIARFKLDRWRIDERADRKRKHLAIWHRQA